MWRGITISLLLHCAILYLIVQERKELSQKDEVKIKIAFLEISEEEIEKEEPPQETTIENISEEFDTPEIATPKLEDVATKEPPQHIEETIIMPPLPSEIAINVPTNTTQTLIASTTSATATTSGGQENVAPFRLTPHYPRRSRSRGEEGIVIISVELDDSGHVIESQIVQSSGYIALDNEAIKSAFRAQADLSSIGNIRNFTFPVEFRLK